MLQNIRENLTGRLALIVLVVIALSFVFVGGASFTTIGSNYAAKVDDAEIGVAQFEAAYRDRVQQNPQLANLPSEYRQQLRSNVLEELIQQRVIDNYLDDAGFEVSDRQLTEALRGVPEFQVDGKFDRETYDDLIASVGMTPAQFESSQKLSMRRNQLQRAIMGTAVVPPSSYRRYLNLAFENRLVTTASISADAVADEVNVSDEMVAAYYDENPDLFNLPETADIQYVEIRRDSVASDVRVSEDDLLEYYEYNKDRYLRDEQRQARHILILFDDDEAGAEQVANEVLTRIRAGESFAELAQQYSKDGGTSADGGNLGALTEEQLPDALGNAIFSMDEGEIRGPVKGDFGFHVVQLDEILESGPLPYEQVRASLLTELQEQEAEGLFLELERKLSAALFDASDINAIAEAVGREVQTYEGFARDSLEPFDGNTSAVDAIFDPVVLSGAQFSEVIEVDANRTAVFAVTQHNAATREPLEAVRDDIVTMLANQQSEDLMAARAEQMLEAVRSGTEFAAAAEAIGATVSEPTVMTRNAETADQFLAVAVFTAVKPEQDKPTLGTTRNGSGGYTVYSLDAVIPGRPEAIPQEQRDAGKDQLEEQFGVGDFVAFVHALRANADVIINDDALAAQDLFQ